jgi:ACT domain-containing protein
MKTRSAEEKAKLMAQVESLQKEQNLSVKNACKKIGIAVGTYYSWGGKEKPARKNTKRKYPQVDLNGINNEGAEKDIRVLIVEGGSKAVGDAIARFFRG